MKVELFNPERVEAIGAGRDGELMDEEANAIERFKEYDKELDQLADLIGENVAELKNRAQNINEVLDVHERKLDNLGNVIDEVGGEVETTTRKMKKVLEKVRAGDKFCVTICLLIVLIGLLVVASNMIF